MTETRPPLLEVRNIDKRFGGLQALNDVSLTVQAGEIHGLIGPNGAGKTTLFNVITGLYPRDGGLLVLQGRQLQGRKPYHIAQAGIARTFQNIRLFGNMTVLENVLVGAHRHGRSGLWGALLRLPATRREEAALRQQAMQHLAYCGLAEHAHELARSLCYGDQRRLEIARALASRPLILALDEPAAGMNGTETATLKQLLSRIRADGISILLIEHDVKLVMGLCDQITVLDYGRKIAEGPPEQVRQHPQVIAAYLGGGGEA